MSISTLIDIFKVLHMLGFVSWFAALFYLPRLFIYHREAMNKPKHEYEILAAQFKIMEWRLYNIIMTPAMILTFIGGFSMLYLMGIDYFKISFWLHWKLAFVLLLLFYHFHCKKTMLLLSEDIAVMSPTQLRMYNEVPTVFLLAILLLAVFKSTLMFVQAFAALVVFVVLLLVGIRLYKKVRQN